MYCIYRPRLPDGLSILSPSQIKPKEPFSFNGRECGSSIPCQVTISTEVMVLVCPGPYRWKCKDGSFLLSKWSFSRNALLARFPANTTSGDKDLCTGYGSAGKSKNWTI